jgi:hypothetical protein
LVSFSSVIPLITLSLTLTHATHVKHSQTTARKQPVNDMQIVTFQVPTEQLVDVIQAALTSDLEISTCQQFIKILPRITMTKRR